MALLSELSSSFQRIPYESYDDNEADNEANNDQRNAHTSASSGMSIYNELLYQLIRR